MTKGKQDKIDFNQALRALEGKIALIEEGKLSPEETCKTVEEGIRLAKMATERLDEIKKSGGPAQGLSRAKSKGEPEKEEREG